MTTVDIQQITDEARRIEPGAVAAKAGRLLLVILAGILWGAGWTVRKTFVVLWLAATWSWTAVRLGWHEAAPKTRS